MSDFATVLLTLDRIERRLVLVTHMLVDLGRGDKEVMLARLQALDREFRNILGETNPTPTKEFNVDAATTAVLKRLDDDSTKIAAVVKGLRDRISTSMTQADVDAVNATLGAIGDRLEATAADPAAPVPPGPVPTLPAQRK